MDNRVGSGNIFNKPNGAGDRYSEEGGRKWYGFYLGFVVKNEDKDQMGRITANVPEVIEETAWAFPCGFAVGKEEGDFDVPKVGEPVMIAFLQGYIDCPVWIKGWFNEQTPPPPYAIRKETNITQKPAGDKITRPTNKVYERDGLVLEVDGTSGQEKIRLFDETTGSQFRIDRKRNIVLIYGKGDVVIETKGKFIVRADGGIDVDGPTTKLGHGDQKGASRITDGSSGSTELSGGEVHSHGITPSKVKLAEGSDNVTAGKGGSYAGRTVTK